MKFPTPRSLDILLFIRLSIILLILILLLFVLLLFILFLLILFFLPFIVIELALSFRRLPPIRHDRWVLRPWWRVRWLVVSYYDTVLVEFHTTGERTGPRWRG
jgi:hypothetical protein